MLSRLAFPVLIAALMVPIACNKASESPIPASLPPSPTPVLGNTPPLVPPGVVTPIPTVTPEVTPEPTITSGEVKQEIKEAADATGTYLSDKGHELKTWSRERMNDLRSDIARLKLKAQSRSENDTSALDKLQVRLGDLEQKMSNFADNSAEKFNETRQSIDTDLADMRQKVSEMMNRDASTTETQTH